MIANVPGIWWRTSAAISRMQADSSQELLEKISTATAMYDGSYFFRLSEVGGRFATMFSQPSAVWSPFGWVVILAAVLLMIAIAFRISGAAERRRQVFLL